MNKQKVRYPIKRIFILDELAVIVAFFLALLVRYQKGVMDWYWIYDGLYESFFIVLIILQALVFFVYDIRKKPLFEQDLVETFTYVIKSRVLLLVFSILFLYATQKGDITSRLVICATFVFTVVLGFIFREVYKRAYIKKHGVREVNSALVISHPFPSIDEIVREYETLEYKEVLVKNSDASHESDVEKVVSELERKGIRTFISIDNNGYDVRSSIVTDVNGFASIPAFVRKERFNLFGINYAISRTEEAVYHVLRNVKELSGKYICFSNVHTSVMGRENAEYRDILNGAAFVFPDGSPIAVLQQKKGLVGAERVAGPDFMEHMFRDTQDGKISHYFYGASQETIDALKENLLKKYPGINIKGMYSPPFRTLSEEEDQADVDMINNSGADILWVGLGAPKQEKWMHDHQGKINAVMMGVGAGFDFHAGTIKRAPRWVQKIGLEWLFRLFQDPKRLFKRYFVTNVKFVWYYIIGLFG
ncbi:WecB/TagA/CpsF family glycosyltransferase [Butyrivibrio proteoclasticus]|uniref:WecB/TagA/CpsF family glycosyltransferase n=1 Tax=Butyrivibrio proteoclasticus TaxID=43305 RepID=UPI000AA051C9|nr:WecB/TagA/CpsF family glycosyltransferase [Butyrivibrio proteoclasticus]